MSDPVENFIAEFESAIDKLELQARIRLLVRNALKQSLRLAQTLEQLDAEGVLPGPITSHDLQRLADDLGERTSEVTAPLAEYVDKAEALCTVIENGLVDADDRRLVETLDRARELMSSPRGVRRDGETQLAFPVCVTCTVCGSPVSGRHSGATNWRGITKQLREHERDVHGGYSNALRDELRSRKASVLAGDLPVTVGQYEFRQA